MYILQGTTINHWDIHWLVYNWVFVYTYKYKKGMKFYPVL